jgi:hypothetical protein
VPDSGQTARWIIAVRIALLALLTANTVFYLFFGTRSEALDSPAWLILLISFEAETSLQERFGGHWTTTALRGVRILAAAALMAAAVGYAFDGEWLDVLNVGLWITIVALLELKLRNPGLARRSARAFAVAATVLYAGLIALVAVWLLRREWFDAYDAALWLAAFAIVELDLLGRPENDAI